MANQIRTYDQYKGEREQEAEALRRAAIFRDLAAEDLQRLAAVAERGVYRRGDLLRGPSTDEDGVFVVVSGAVRVLLTSAEGRELTLCTRQAGDVFELCDVAGELVGDVGAEATEAETVVFVISWPYLLELLAFRAGAALSLATLLRDGLLHERRLIAELAFFNMRSRLAHKLAELAAEDPTNPLTVSREELAALVGTRSEEVSRALRHFMEEGLISYRPRGRLITVQRLDRLSHY